jgi:hypothetical protein
MAVSNRTWVCIKCGKTYRRAEGTLQVRCAGCGDACESIPTKIRVPSPVNRLRWEQFWREYPEEVRIFREWKSGKLKQDVRLPILKVYLCANAK